MVNVTDVTGCSTSTGMKLSVVPTYRSNVSELISVYFDNEANWVKLFKLAAREVGEFDAGDVVNKTYIEIKERADRGQGHYDADYSCADGTSFESYVSNVFRHLLKMARVARETSGARGVREAHELRYVRDERDEHGKELERGARKKVWAVSEADFISIEEDADAEGYIASIASEEIMEDNILDELEPRTMVACERFLGVCADTETNPVAFIRAVRSVEDPCMVKAASVAFGHLGKAAKKNSGVISAIADFVRIYGAHPDETEMCLAQLGIVAV